MTLTQDKKKILVASVGVGILIALVVGVFYSLVFIREGLQGVVGDIGPAETGAVQFNFAQAEALGVSSGQ